MKGIISKVTFGFLMAQIVPGSIAVNYLAFLYLGILSNQQDSFSTIATKLCNLWDGSLITQLALVGLCTGFGMLIHRVHWAVLGFLETHYAIKGEKGTIEALQPVYTTYWHNDNRFIFQILLGPIKIVVEIFQLLFFAKDIRSVVPEESVHEIDKDKMEAFNFAQDFYLYFAQFYAHTSYALVVGLFSMVINAFILGFSFRCCFLIVNIYILSGLFFLISRIQLGSLFKTEISMKKKNVNIKYIYRP